MHLLPPLDSHRVLLPNKFITLLSHLRLCYLNLWIDCWLSPPCHTTVVRVDFFWQACSAYGKQSRTLCKICKCMSFLKSFYFYEVLGPYLWLFLLETFVMEQWEASSRTHISGQILPSRRVWWEGRLAKLNPAECRWRHLFISQLPEAKNHRETILITALFGQWLRHISS